MITYAGTPLLCATAELAAAVEALVSVRDVFPWVQRTWPGTGREHWSWPGLRQTDPTRPVKVGTLWWPTGATRFAVGYFLVSDAQAAVVRQSAYGGSNTAYQPRDLNISQERPVPGGPDQLVDLVSTKMWLHSLRPLSQIPGANGLWLLTLVDERYFWNQLHSDTVVISVEDETTWAQVYEQIGTALGVTVTADAVASAYLTPPKLLNANYEPVAALLDTVAYNVGQRVVRNFDGTVEALNYTSSKARVDATVLDLSNSGRKVQGGGRFLFNASEQPNDLAGVFPHKVAVRFPFRSADATADDYYLLECPYSDVAFLTGQLQTNDSIKTFHDTRPAIYTGNPPTTFVNQTELTDLARQIAKDYYRHQLGAYDLKLVGVYPWKQEGLHDSVEFVYREGEVSTRVQRPAFNDETEQLCHGDPPPYPVLVRLVAVHERRFAWEELEELTDGTFQLLANGRTGTKLNCSAYEINGGSENIPYGTRVWITPGHRNAADDLEWLFEFSGWQFGPTTTSTTTNGCSGTCVWNWSTYFNQWFLTTSTCGGAFGCECDGPQYCGSFECEFTFTDCVVNAQPALYGCVNGTGTTGTTAACVSTCYGHGCYYNCDEGSNTWVLISGDCHYDCPDDPGCGCTDPAELVVGGQDPGACSPCQSHFEKCAFHTTTTTTETTTTTPCPTTTTDPGAPSCGTCTYAGHKDANGGISWVQTSNDCTGVCYCDYPQLQPCCPATDVNPDCDKPTSSIVNCVGPGTTTTCTTSGAPPSDNCGACNYSPSYLGGSYATWVLTADNCTDGCSCQAPECPPGQDGMPVTPVNWPCVNPTTTCENVSTDQGCGTCAYFSDLSTYEWVKQWDFCVGSCTCPVPECPAATGGDWTYPYCQDTTTTAP